VYGAGLSGTGGFVPSLTLGGCPDLGKTITLSLTNGLGGAPSALLIAAAPASLPLFGGTLLVDPAAVQVPMFLGGAPGVAGAGSFSIPVLLSDPSLTGVSTFLQLLSVDLQAPQYISFSNGLQIVFG
jgi:hypothetical protein